MHELGLAMEVIDIVTARTSGKVSRVVLEVGVLAAVLPDALKFGFEVASQGTVAEDAVLEVIEVAALARCGRCKAEFELTRPFGQCACGCTELDWLRGDELKIQSVEVS